MKTKLPTEWQELSDQLGFQEFTPIQTQLFEPLLAGENLLGVSPTGTGKTLAYALEAFGKKWNDKYPMIQAAWERNWNDLIEFFNYPMDIRKAIYTTNTIESLNFSLRKITRNKSSFPDDDSIYKVMYLAIRNASKRWTMPIRNWALAVNQFAILFDKRVPIC